MKVPKRSDAKPWERREGESAKAFEAFNIYLDLGPERSIRAASDKLGKFRTQLERWSSAYGWVERAASYDAHIQKQARIGAAKKARQMADRHIGIALKMQEKALSALAALDPKDIDAKTIVAIMREATKLEQESRAYILEDTRCSADDVAEDSENMTDVVIYVPENGRDGVG